MKIKKNTKLISEKNLVDRFVQLINEAPPMSFDPELGEQGLVNQSNQRLKKVKCRLVSLG